MNKPKLIKGGKFFPDLKKKWSEPQDPPPRSNLYLVSNLPRVIHIDGESWYLVNINSPVHNLFSNLWFNSIPPLYPLLTVNILHTILLLQNIIRQCVRGSLWNFHYPGSSVSYGAITIACLGRQGHITMTLSLSFGIHFP